MLKDLELARIANSDEPLEKWRRKMLRQMQLAQYEGTQPKKSQ